MAINKNDLFFRLSKNNMLGTRISAWAAGIPCVNYNKVFTVYPGLSRNSVELLTEIKHCIAVYNGEAGAIAIARDDFGYGIYSIDYTREKEDMARCIAHYSGYGKRPWVEIDRYIRLTKRWLMQ